MTSEGPSWTSRGAALIRAAHRLLDDEPWILDDPFARGLAGLEDEAHLRAVIKAQALPEFARMRAFFAIRSRWAEDELRRALRRGVAQYVILGAGLDSFAYRNPDLLSTLRVYEVDRPADQAWKRNRLAEMGVPIPEGLVYVPTDFERESLRSRLQDAGFDPGFAAFFSWLGVTQYLRREAVLATLREVAKSAPGSEIVFEFTVSDEALDAADRRLAADYAERAAGYGEPWRSRFHPGALRLELGRLGFSGVHVLSIEEATDRYLRGRRDGLALPSPWRLVRAKI